LRGGRHAGLYVVFFVRRITKRGSDVAAAIAAVNNRSVAALYAAAARPCITDKNSRNRTITAPSPIQAGTGIE